jgi:hypothetical protein
MIAEIYIVGFWIMAPYSLVGGYHCFAVTY